ncbi:RNA-binding protein 26 [Toxocara canis]|nr:RNA-binding protein 26 [Toxocara canis]
MKGDQCIYDHGPDPVVVDDIALEKMVTNGSKAPPAPPVAQMAPNFSVPPPGYTPLNPPPPGVDNVYVANSTAPAAVALSEGYNPEAPALSAPSVATVPPAIQAPDFSVPPPPLPAHLSNPPWHSATYTVPSASASVLVHPPTAPYDPAPPSTTVPSVPVVQQTLSTGAVVTRRGRGGAMMGMGRYGHTNLTSNVANNRTLQVRKIPAEMNNIAKLNEHFANFGQIINIQVCYEGDPEAALITYSTRGEAMAAYKSTTPILNNRFIKVFWHAADAQHQTQTTQPPQYSHTPGLTSGSAVTYNPMKGSLTKTVHIGGAPRAPSFSQNALATVQPNAANQPVSAHTEPSAPFANVASAQPTITDKEKYIEIRRKRKQEKENKMRLLDLHRRKSALLGKEIEQQKLIIKTLQNTTNAEKKKQLCNLFKKVDESVKALKTELEDLSSKLLAMNKSTSESNGQNAGSEETNAEMDANGVSAGAKRTRSVSDASGDGYQADAVSPPKKSRHLDSTQALDNRPRVVAVRGFKVEHENDVIVHMEHFGELVDMDFAAGGRSKPVTAYFTYKTRRDAEQAVALGADFAGCPITVEWATKGSTDEGGVVPDEMRNPSERVTPAALLASCPLEESDEEGDNE